jgi:hypothetical protein
LALVEPDLDEDFFPRSMDLIHFAGDFPIGAKSAAHPMVQRLQRNRHISAQIYSTTKFHRHKPTKKRSKQPKPRF